MGGVADQHVVSPARFDGGHRRFELVAHTAAGIEDQSHRRRCFVRGKIDDPLLDVIFEQLEIVFSQAGDRPVPGIRHRHRDLYDSDIQPDGVRLRGA